MTLEHGHIIKNTGLRMLTWLQCKLHKLYLDRQRPKVVISAFV